MEVIDDARQSSELADIARKVRGCQRGKRSKRARKFGQLREVGVLQLVCRIRNGTDLSADTGRNLYTARTAEPLNRRYEIRQLFNVSFGQLCRRVCDLFDPIRRSGQTGAALGYGLELPQCLFQQFKPV